MVAIKPTFGVFYGKITTKNHQPVNPELLLKDITNATGGLVSGSDSDHLLGTAFINTYLGMPQLFKTVKKPLTISVAYKLNDQRHHYELTLTPKKPTGLKHHFQDRFTVKQSYKHLVEDLGTSAWNRVDGLEKLNLPHPNNGEFGVHVYSGGTSFRNPKDKPLLTSQTKAIEVEILSQLKKLVKLQPNTYESGTFKIAPNPSILTSLGIWWKRNVY